MPLVSLKEVLDWAEAHNAAVPAFNIDNIDIAQSLMLAAEEEQKPVILAVGQGAIRVGRLDLLASVVKTLAARSALPVVLHLDHGASFEQTVACIRAGFTSVMFDGSSLPLRENIEQTRLVIKAAHAVGVSVEAELGDSRGRGRDCRKWSCKGQCRGGGGIYQRRRCGCPGGLHRQCAWSL